MIRLIYNFFYFRVRGFISIYLGKEYSYQTHLGYKAYYMFNKVFVFRPENLTYCVLIWENPDKFEEKLNDNLM